MHKSFFTGFLSVVPISLSRLTAIVILAFACGGESHAQVRNIWTDTMGLLKTECSDFTPLSDVSVSPPATRSGVALCLDALDRYSDQNGGNDPDRALQDLIGGRPATSQQARFFTEAQNKSTSMMTEQLAVAGSGSKLTANNVSAVNALFKKAETAINSAYSADVSRFESSVNDEIKAQHPYRALFNLLKSADPTPTTLDYFDGWLPPCPPPPCAAAPCVPAPPPPCPGLTPAQQAEVAAQVAAKKAGADKTLATMLIYHDCFRIDRIRLFKLVTDLYADPK